MRLLLGCAGILILLASGPMAAATGLANSPRFEELIRPADAAVSYPVADAVICENVASVDEARGNPARAEQIGLPVRNWPPFCAELARIAVSEGKLAEAEDYAMRSLSILHLQPEPHAAAVAAAKVALSSVYIQLHDLHSAASILPEDVAVNPWTLAASIHLLDQLRAEQWAREISQADKRPREPVVHGVRD